MYLKKGGSLNKEALIFKVQACLSDDLLSPEWRKRKKPKDDFTTGHCYIAAEAAYHAFGKKHGYKPKVISGKGWTHWYLQNSEGDIIDPTKEQFLPKQPPYNKGRGNGFLTKRPSKRCRLLLERMRIRVVKPKERVKVRIAPHKGRYGTVKHVDGGYVYVQVDGTKHLIEYYHEELVPTRK